MTKLSKNHMTHAKFLKCISSHFLMGLKVHTFSGGAPAFPPRPSPPPSPSHPAYEFSHVVLLMLQHGIHYCTGWKCVCCSSSVARWLKSWETTSSHPLLMVTMLACSVMGPATVAKAAPCMVQTRDRDLSLGCVKTCLPWQVLRMQRHLLEQK